MANHLVSLLALGGRRTDLKLIRSLSFVYDHVRAGLVWLGLFIVFLEGKSAFKLFDFFPQQFAQFFDSFSGDC